MAAPATNNIDPDQDEQQEPYLNASEKQDRRWGRRSKKANQEDTNDPGSDESNSESASKPDAKKTGDSSMSPDQIKSAEEGGQPQSNFNYREEAGKVSRFAGKGKASRNQLLIGGGSMGAILLAVILLMLLLSSFKVVHFGEVMAATGYARFGGIMKERMTQNIFDASLAEGDGTVTNRGKTLVDKVKVRNVDNQIASLGREGKMSFMMENGKMTGVRVEGKPITLNDLAKESFNKSDFNSLTAREKLTVRRAFVSNVQTSLGDALAEQPRYLRGRIFATIADNVGFKFSRWAQAGRKLAGKSALDAKVQDTLDSVEQITDDSEIKGISGDTAEYSKQLKNADKLKAYLTENGGVFDKKSFTDAVMKDLESSVKIQRGAAAVSNGFVIASLACMANQAFSHTKDIQNSNEKSASKQGLQLVSANHQTQRGAVTSAAEQTAAQQLNGAEQSAFYQYHTNKPVSTEGQDIPRLGPSTKNKAFIDIVTAMTKPTNWVGGAAFSGVPLVGDALDTIDDKFCGAVLNPAGAVVVGSLEAVVTAVVGFYSAGGGAAAAQGGGKVAVSIFLRELGTAFLGTAKGVFSLKSLGTLAGFTAYSAGLQLVANSVSGTTFFGAEQGGSYYTNGAIGTEALQSRQARSMYSRPLPPDQAKTVDEQYIGMVRQDYQRQNFFARYFSPYNPYSLTGMASAQVPGNLNGGLNVFKSMLGSASNILKPTSIFNTVSSAISPKAFAADDDFDPYAGQVPWGLSPGELYKIRNDDSYKFYNNINFISDAQIQAYDSKYGKCFDPARSQTDVDDDDDCKLGNPIWDDDMFFRYRLAKMDGQLTDMTQEDLSKPTGGNTASATDPSAPPTSSAIVGDIGQSSDSVPCAAGTTDQGVVTSKYTGNLKTTAGPLVIRLCKLSSIGNVTVNSRVSGAWQALGEAAKADGVNLTAGSSFRLEDSCGGTGDGTLCAKPGKSIHQLGVAIDFSIDQSVKGTSTSSCSGRGRRPDNAFWVWLEKNAEKFGFRQYTYEPWHWDAWVDPSRCGTGQ